MQIMGGIEIERRHCGYDFEKYIYLNQIITAIDLRALSLAIS